MAEITLALKSVQFTTVPKHASWEPSTEENAYNHIRYDMIWDMSTALLSSFEIKKNYDWEKCAKINYTCIHIVLTNDVSPRNSQDDKILSKHIKINWKVNPF